MVDRAAVEVLAQDGRQERAPVHIGPETLRELARVYLAWLDAPEASVKWVADIGMTLESCRLSSDLIGRRVRLVAESTTTEGTNAGANCATEGGNG